MRTRRLLHENSTTQPPWELHHTLPTMSPAHLPQERTPKHPPRPSTRFPTVQLTASSTHPHRPTQRIPHRRTQRLTIDQPPRPIHSRPTGRPTDDPPNNSPEAPPEDHRTKHRKHDARAPLEHRQRDATARPAHHQIEDFITKEHQVTHVCFISDSPPRTAPRTAPRAPRLAKEARYDLLQNMVARCLRIPPGRPPAGGGWHGPCDGPRADPAGSPYR